MQAARPTNPIPTNPRYLTYDQAIMIRDQALLKNPMDWTKMDRMCIGMIETYPWTPEAPVVGMVKTEVILNNHSDNAN